MENSEFKSLKVPEVRQYRSKRIAFTLAEVLITLGIIGVVAAMTIPTLVKNYEKKVTITKLKKMYSTVNQALQLSVAENGEYSGWDTPQIIGDKPFYNKYLFPYFKNTVLCSNYQICPYEIHGISAGVFYYLNGTESPFTPIANGRITMLFPDGSIMIFSLSGANGSKVFLDVNGVKKPNMFGKDVFIFERNENGNLIPFCHDKTDAQVQSSCSENDTGQCCAEKIMRDGWEFRNDYPW